MSKLNKDYITKQTPWQEFCEGTVFCAILFGVIWVLFYVLDRAFYKYIIGINYPW